jgi:DNA-binding PadR family transcriptional regulator
MGALILTRASFYILLSLVDDERHGYGIMLEVTRLTDGAVHLNSATLYRSIKQLLAAGYIEEIDERPDPALDDERRRYYRLTEAGKRAAEMEAMRLEQAVRLAEAKHLLRPGTAEGRAP